MESESASIELIEHQNGYDEAIHDFEKFARQVFYGKNENEKTKLYKKLEEFMTFKELYKKKHDSEELQDAIAQHRKRKLKNPVTSNYKKMKFEPTKLPNEIWLKIISFLKTSDLLKRFNLVRKHFNGLSLDSSAIKSLHLKSIDNRLLYHQVVTVLKRCKTLHELTFEGCSYVKDLLSHALKSSPRLIRLKLKGVSISVKLLSEAAKIKKLKSLIIEDCWNSITKTSSEFSITEDFKNAIAENCKQLEEFEKDDVTVPDFNDITNFRAIKYLKFCSKTTLNAEQIRTLANHHQIKVIHLYFRYGEDLENIASALDDFFLQQKKSLQKVKIEVLQGTGKSKNTSILNHTSLSLCDNLKEIDASLTYLSKSDYLALFQASNLKKLKLRGGYGNFSADLIKKLVTNNSLNNLQELHSPSELFKTSNPKLIFQFPKLKQLILFGAPWILSEDKQNTSLFSPHTITGIVINQMYCPLLERLYLSNFYDDKPFNLDAFDWSVQKFPNLKSLQINGHIDNKLNYDHLYNVCKETSIFISLGMKHDYSSLYFSSSIKTYQEEMEYNFRKIDKQFFLKYQDMKKKHIEWCVLNNWPIGLHKF